MTDIAEETRLDILQAATLIKNSHNTAVLTGAGSSTPSGIPDFRSEGSGLWTRFLPMEVASLTSFRHNTERFFAWLRPLASHMLSAQPNPAHIALAQLAQAGYVRTIITQNIDGLHQRAGARDVLEVHGTFRTLTCVGCYQQYEATGYIEPYLEEGIIPRCQSCGRILKPDVILFEEQLPIKTWLKAEETSRNCDVMLVAGTSLEVMPVARLPLNAVESGAKLIIVNKTATYIDVRADVVLRGDVADFIPRIAAEVLSA